MFRIIQVFYLYYFFDMKKILMIWLLFLCSVILVWCSKSIDVNDSDIIDDENEWWGERITVITDMCGEEWWEIGEITDDEWEIQEACLYSDGSYCELNDLSVNQCYKWLMKLED